MQGVGLVAAVFVLGALLLDEGEVVTLITHGEGRSYTTQLWIVRVEGQQYLRAGSSRVRWLRRLRANPDVWLRASPARSEQARAYRARPIADEGVRERVNRAMLLKYGLADRLWGLFSSRRKSVSILLELAPVEAWSAAPGLADGPGDSP